MTFYDLLVFIHIFSAIIGIGPGFILTFIVMKPKTMIELRHGYLLRRRLHIFVMVGAILLLISGLLMGVMNPILFQMGWYVMSLGLFFVTLLVGPLVLKPRLQPIKQMFDQYEGEDIPEEYDSYAKDLFFYEHITNLIIIIIIILMVFKPF